MKLPVPKQPDTTVILETYSKNELPFKFSEVQISINGPDIVVKTADGHTMTFPFAAQFATMGKQVFTLVFADGKEIPSDQLLGKRHLKAARTDSWIVSKVVPTK
jgi:hypothetical protein